MKAIWKGATLAESDKTILVEGNHYFPPESIHREYLRESATHTTCSWKGVASYYSVQVDSEINKDAAWYYPEPTQLPRRSKTTWLSGAAWRFRHRGGKTA